ncbi:hypothetical protein [Pedobacter frigoris]|uniref:hypothetical protein n=1 Tax=Pedobacter frigoris TaxID=2571272 RepID=UPI002931D7A8|nr:hypothetical protein [Pedobacter frigoris]
MTKKVRKSYNSLKWVLGILLFGILLLVAMSWYLSVKIQPVIKTQVRTMVLNATDSLYRIEFSDVSTNFITGSATLNDVTIIPDTVIYKKLTGLKLAPNNIYYVRLKKLMVRNFHPWNALRFRKLKIDVLLFDNPDVVMVNRQFDFNESKRQHPDKSPYDYISGYLKELKVKTIDFKNISFKYVNNNTSVPQVDSIKNLNITLKNWLIDKNSAKDESRFYFLKDIVINLNNYSFATPDSLYHLNLNELNFSAASGKLYIKSFRVVPRYDEMKFGQVAGFAKDRFNIEMSDMSLEGIDLPLYIRKQELYAKEMNISNGFVEVFNNNSLPKETEARIGKYPHQLLQKVKGLITVKQLNLNNVDISYAEFDRDSRQKGKITFERTSGSITNVTNSTVVKAQNHYMFANLTSYMMGQGRLDVNFRFDLNARDGAFIYSGKLGPMDGRVLNRITKPLGMVEVKSGKVRQLDFDINANDLKASGKVDFAFNDLSVALLKKDEAQGRLVKQGLMSFLANAMVINSDNPNAAGVLLAAPIKYERVKTASFFNFIWKTLFQGIKYSVGVTPEKERKIKLQIANFEKMKSDRDKRRAERQKRKARKENRR